MLTPFIAVKQARLTCATPKLKTGMNAQHSFTAHRLRHHPDLFDCSSKDFSTSEGRRAHRVKIGWKEDDEYPEKSHYDCVDVPLLHSEYEGKFNRSTFMLNPALFVVSLSIDSDRIHAYIIC